MSAAERLHRSKCLCSMALRRSRRLEYSWAAASKSPAANAALAAVSGDELGPDIRLAAVSRWCHRRSNPLSRGHSATSCSQMPQGSKAGNAAWSSTSDYHSNS
eukprot:scaffold104046_cov63-Phaeocystis_antarctica.AAC.5